MYNFFHIFLGGVTLGRKISLVLIAVLGLFYIFYYGERDDSFKMLFKLLPMILILGLAISTKAKNIPQYYLLISIGLVFCTIGDYTLQWFIVGLSFFLTGHLFYISAFLTAKDHKTPTAVKVILAVYGIAMAGWIAGTLFSKGDIVMGIAVCAYILVILLMGWTSWRTGSKYAIIGSTLFILSDSFLAINKFIVDLPISHILIMSTYYGAQILLALSISQYSVIRNKVVQ